MLVGVIQAGKARALIRSSVSGQGGWMSIGEDIDGWRLREVADKRRSSRAKGGVTNIFFIPAPTPIKGEKLAGKPQLLLFEWLIVTS